MFNQRIGRTLHRPVDAASAQQAAHQRRLAGCRGRLQGDDHPARAAPARARRRTLRVAAASGKMQLSDAGEVRRMNGTTCERDWAALGGASRHWGAGARFRGGRASPTSISPTRKCGLLNWLDAGRHGEMDYMARHGDAPRAARGARARHAARDHRPDELLAGAATPARDVLADSQRGYVARYALRARLPQGAAQPPAASLAQRIEAEVGAFGYRVFTDSAPVLEVALAAQAGLGWRGKHTLLLDARHGLVFLPRRNLHRPAAAA